MISWIDFFYFFIIGAALLLGMMGLWFIAVMPGADRWGKRFFLGFFGVLMLGSISCLVGTVMSYLPVSSAAIKPVVAVECLLLALPVPMLTAYLLHCCKEEHSSKARAHVRRQSDHRAERRRRNRGDDRDS